MSSPPMRRRRHRRTSLWEGEGITIDPLDRWLETVVLHEQRIDGFVQRGGRWLQRLARSRERWPKMNWLVARSSMT